MKTRRAKALGPNEKALANMITDWDNDTTNWIDDLGGRGFDELRDLPYAVQAGLDIAVFE